jgi:hypothetical protein
MNKQCTKCKNTLPVDMFPRRRKDRPVLASHCKNCRSAICKDWEARKRNENKIIEKSYVFDQLSKSVQRWYA